MVRSEKRNILLVVVISVLAVSVYANECGDHSWEWTNHCYSFHAEKKSRDDASSICRQEGGYLVALNSKEEEDFVTEHLQRNENMFVEHVDFSYIEHEEDAVLESRGRLQREYCEHHYNGTLLQSSLNVLAQNEIPLGSPRRALLSTPAGFSIRSSLIPRAGLGAWSAGLVPRHTVLGEYEGEAVENPRDFTYCWQTESGSRPLYIDGRDEGRSNWLRYVNCARDSREENTDTFNCGGRKFYYTTKDVHPDSELLVWYGASYGKWLGIERNNPGFDFPCGSLNVRMGSIYYVYDKRWVHSDWSNVTYTNWSRDQRTKTRDQSVGLILTHRQTRWHWIPELDYSYYLQEHSPKLPFVCERTKGRSFFLRHQTT